MTRSFFILWNGSEEAFHDRGEAIADTSEGLAVPSNWSFGRGFNSPEQGDLVYLLRTGSLGGLVASGEISESGVVEGDHWSDPEKTAWYIALEWTAAVDNPDILPVEDLRDAIPEYKFPVQASGRLIYEPEASEVAIRWRRHLDDVAAKRAKPFLGGTTRSAGSRSPEKIPLERRYKASYRMEGTVSREALRRESELVSRFVEQAEEFGLEPKRHRIQTTAGTLLFTDLYDESSDTLYEAKADAGRNAVRLALGQLLDYRRYFTNPPKVSVLLPAEPELDLILLLRQHEIGCVFESDTGEFHRT